MCDLCARPQSQGATTTTCGQCGFSICRECARPATDAITSCQFVKEEEETKNQDEWLPAQPSLCHWCRPLSNKCLDCSLAVCESVDADYYNDDVNDDDHDNNTIEPYTCLANHHSDLEALRDKEIALEECLVEMEGQKDIIFRAMWRFKELKQVKDKLEQELPQHNQQERHDEQPKQVHIDGSPNSSTQFPRREKLSSLISNVFVGFKNKQNGTSNNKM
ncbi:hypothetical protein ACA910_019779 [Epithemia clementina (nom. ined.)]